MKLRGTVDQIKAGGTITYNDGRAGHTAVSAKVLSLDRHGMEVQFEDRADTNYIRFSDKSWMDFIELAI